MESPSEPAGLRDPVKADAVRDPYLLAELQRIRRALPRMYGWRPTTCTRDKPEFKAIRDCFNIPITNPLQTNTVDYAGGTSNTCKLRVRQPTTPTTNCQRPTTNNHQPQSPTTSHQPLTKRQQPTTTGIFSNMALVCPHTFFRNSCPAKFCCPYCKSSANVSMDGLAAGIRTAVGWGGHYTAVLVRRYRCRGCPKPRKPGNRSRAFDAIHPDVIAQCNPDYIHRIPWRISGKSLVALSIVDMLTSLRISGLAFNAFSRAHLFGAETAHLRRWLSFNHSVLWAKKNFVFNSSAPTSVRYRKFASRFIGPKLARAIYLDEHARRSKARVSPLTAAS